MERIEYKGVVDKAEWPRGAWDKEPDKVQWQDEATGLPCLIVRGPVGSWCGYVGVPASHPWHGKGYSDCTYRWCGESYCGHSPCSIIGVHGGITFAGECSDHSYEEWEAWSKRKASWEIEAKKYPRGDSARRLKDWKECFDNFEKWKQRKEAVSICHIPGQGEPDNVWWFGFDCAHLGDLSPGMSSLCSERYGRDDTYKTADYVTKECGALASQLFKIKGGMMMDIVSFLKHIGQKIRKFFESFRR